MAQLATVDNPAAVMRELFQREIEALKNDKTDTDDKIKEILKKKIRPLPSSFITEDLQNIIESYSGHNKVQSLEESASLFAESFLRLKRTKSQ